LLGGEQFKTKLTTVGAYTYVDPANPANRATIVVANANFGQGASLFLPVVVR
jgi:3-isopropylmalate dehydratase small subunit